MENWSAQTFAALKNQSRQQRQEQTITKTYERALRRFKHSLKQKLKLQYKNKILLSSPKKAYLNNLAKLGLEPSLSDENMSDDSDDQTIQLQRLPTLEASI